MKNVLSERKYISSTAHCIYPETNLRLSGPCVVQAHVVQGSPVLGYNVTTHLIEFWQMT